MSEADPDLRTRLSEARREHYGRERKALQQRCRENLTQWAIEALSPYNESPAKHHRFLLDKLTAVAQGEIDRLMIFMPPGSAKALALDTPIPTPEGWKLMGELQVGDRVFDENGLPCHVTVVSEVFRDRPVYRVHTDSGDDIIADADHEWRVCLCRKPRKPLSPNAGRKGRPDRDDPASRYKLKTTEQLARKRVKRPMIEVAKPLILPEADLPLDPWVLGVWLGNGDTRDAGMTTSLEDAAWVRQEIEAAGHETRIWRTSRVGDAARFGVSDLRGRLVRLGVLGNKHIPPVYLRGSIEQRIALLQGLMDTDGSIATHGQAEFTNTNRNLAEGVQELVRSLGVKASFLTGRAMLNGKDCGPYYRVLFYHPEAARIPRKRQRCRSGKRTPNTYIDVEPIGRADTRCIAVDSPSHLFLAGRSMTPTHNTRYASIVFPAWLFAQRPRFDMIGASYNSEYSDGISLAIMRLIQENAETLGYNIIGGSRKFWYTSNRGQYRSAGAGAGITGRRADCVIVDDPLRGREDADSPIVRDRIWKWYRAEVITRLKPGARVVIIMTRWHFDDLAGRLLDAQETGAGDSWEVINLPALAEPGDVLGRAPGEALWPEWEDETALHRKRIAVGEREWAALYQQNPSPTEGALFKVHLMPTIDEAPECVATCRAWDLAATEKSSADWTVGLKLGRTSEGRYVVLDIVRLRGSPDEVRTAISMTARLDGHGVMIRVPEDPGQAGKAQALDLGRMLTGYRIVATRDTGSKSVRAGPVASQLNLSNVSMVRAPWNRAFIDELSEFPFGAYDDQVDSLAASFEQIGLGRAPLAVSSAVLHRMRERRGDRMPMRPMAR